MKFKKDDKVIFLTKVNPNFTAEKYAFIWDTEDGKDDEYKLVSKEGNMITNVKEEDLQFVSHEEGACNKALEASKAQMKERTSLPYIVERFRSNKPLEITSWLALFSGVGIKSSYFTDYNLQALQNEILVMYKPFRAMFLLQKKEMCDNLEDILKNPEDFEKNFLDLYAVVEEAFPFTDKDREDFLKREKEMVEKVRVEEQPSK